MNSLPTRFAAALADPRLWHPTKGFECIVERVVAPNISRLYEIVRERRAPDTVVGASALCLGARIAQEHLGIPMASIELQPALLRSLIDAGMQGRVPMGPGVPRWVKKAFFRLADVLVVDRVLGPPLNAFRAKLGLPAVRRILAQYIHSPRLVLGFFPKWFARPQPDWPAKTHLTGFVLHEAGERVTVSAEVEEFLAGGPAPVLFTPGTGAAQQTKFFRESVEACRLAGLRGMLVTSHSQQIPRDLRPRMRAFSYVPFGKVLRRCSALVYHGGVGTLAQGIKAGIPHLVVPNSHDQPDNARRVEATGIGLPRVPGAIQGCSRGSNTGTANERRGAQATLPGMHHAGRFAGGSGEGLRTARRAALRRAKCRDSAAERRGSPFLGSSPTGLGMTNVLLLHTVPIVAYTEVIRVDGVAPSFAFGGFFGAAIGRGSARPGGLIGLPWIGVFVLAGSTIVLRISLLRARG
jgi:rhamnosyltransferase subunit B